MSPIPPPLPSDAALDLAALWALHEAATPDRWGRYGSAEPTQGAFEAAPGLTIGSNRHTEPIARFSGYLLPVEANADCAAAARNALPALLRRLAAAEAELARLKARPQHPSARIQQPCLAMSPAGRVCPLPKDHGGLHELINDGDLVEAWITDCTPQPLPPPERPFTWLGD
jgi:hypothetical protein